MDKKQLDIFRLHYESVTAFTAYIRSCLLRISLVNMEGRRLRFRSLVSISCTAWHHLYLQTCSAGSLDRTDSPVCL